MSKCMPCRVKLDCCAVQICVTLHWSCMHAVAFTSPPADAMLYNCYSPCIISDQSQTSIFFTIVIHSCTKNCRPSIMVGTITICRDAWNSPRTQQRASGLSSRRRRSRSRSRDRVRRNSGSPYSRGTDTEDGEVKEPSSPARPGELSARQNARLADLSLLLDVILKTDYARYDMLSFFSDKPLKKSHG